MPLSALPEALTLDVGHTFLFPDPPLGETYVRKAASHGIPSAVDWSEQAWKDAWERTKAGRQGRLIYGTSHEEGLGFWIEVYRRMRQGQEPDPQAHRAFVRDLYESYGRADLWRVDPALDRLLDVCARCGVRVALVSNWDLRLRGLLAELELLDRFQAVAISAEVGIEKPDPRIFHHALRRLDTSADRAIHVGDTWADDIRGARACGMEAVWLAPDDTPMPEFLRGVRRVESLAALAEQLCQSFCPVG